LVLNQNYRRDLAKQKLFCLYFTLKKGITMNKINRLFEATFFILLLSLFITSLNAKEYNRDGNGNININIIDREVSINNEQVGIISSVERVGVDEYEIGIDEDDEIEVETENLGEIVVGEDVSVDIDTISSFFDE